MTKKAKVGIIGTGNIGTDILCKIQRSEYLECTIFAGRNPESKGIEFARQMGVKTSIRSIDAILEDPDCCDIVFDATSASAHLVHAPLLEKLNKYVIDLTPSGIGKMCVPVINMEECLNVKNVNLITCGGQGTVPIACAIRKAQDDIRYLEIVATISSKSAGLGTRNNIDEFTQSTSDALKKFTGVEKSKAIIVLNPAEPPITMHNTIYALIDDPDMDRIRKNVFEMEQEIKKYVPGYKVTVEPTYENGRVTTMIEVVGLGDYLPKYAGNLDIITCAAVEVAENFAKIMAKEV